jgi:hypothetical protein
MAIASLAGSPIGVVLSAVDLYERHEQQGLEAWFAEYPGFVVEVSDLDAFRAIAAKNDVDVLTIGATLESPDMILMDLWKSLAEHGESGVRERVALVDLREAWEAPLRSFYGSVA